MSARTENKQLDEKLLALVNRVQILDEDFLALKVEDTFFGRMTDISVLCYTEKTEFRGTGSQGEPSP